MNKEIKYRDLLLSVQGALLGEVVGTLRGVAVEIRNNEIMVYYYNDGEVSDDLYDDFTSIGTEIMADFTPPVTVDEKIINLPKSEPLPDHDFWAFLRKEE